MAAVEEQNLISHLAGSQRPTPLPTTLMALLGVLTMTLTPLYPTLSKSPAL